MHISSLWTEDIYVSKFFPEDGLSVLFFLWNTCFILGVKRYACDAIFGSYTALNGSGRDYALIVYKA